MSIDRLGRKARLLSLAFAAACFGAVSAASALPDETGLYIYMRWPSLPHWKPIYEEAIAADYTDGASISLEWNRIEPSPGVYDWSTLDPWIDLTLARHKKLAIGVIAGDLAPKWLYDAKIGVPQTQFNYNKNPRAVACAVITQPVFWSEAYLSRYAELLNALAAHLRSGTKGATAYDALTVIKISGINATTEELRIAANKPDDGPCKQSDAAAVWANAGYTPQKAMAAWVRTAEDTGRAFPDKILAVDVIHRTAFPTVDDAGHAFALEHDAPDAMTLKIVDRGVQMFGHRFMAKWDALSQAKGLPAEVLEAGRKGAKIGWQMNSFLGLREGSGCIYVPFAIKPCASLADFQAIIENGVATGGRLIEIQPPNANAKFAPALEAGRRSLHAAGPR